MNDPADLEAAGWWLSLALGDLAAARALVAAGTPALRPAAALAQQAAEKALKAALVLGGGEPPRSHSLPLLARQVRLEVGEEVDLVALTDAWTTGRSPDPGEPVLEPVEVDRLVTDAERVVGAVAQLLGERGVDVTGLEPR